MDLITKLYGNKNSKCKEVAMLNKNESIVQVKVNRYKVNFRQVRLIGAERKESKDGRYKINLIDIEDSGLGIAIKVMKDSKLHDTTIHVFVNGICVLFGFFDTEDDIHTFNLNLSSKVEEIYLRVIDRGGRVFVTEPSEERYKAVILKSKHMRIVK